MDLQSSAEHKMSETIKPLQANFAPEKKYISIQDLYHDSYALGHQILKSGYRPDFIVALWRGGCPIGMIIQEYLEYHGIPSDHIAIRTSSYTKLGVQSSKIRIHGLDYILNAVVPENKLLIIDDVFDSGRTLDTIIHTITEKTRRNCPTNIKLGTLYFKPAKNCTARKPDFFLHDTDDWLVFPHELVGLTPEEIKAHKSPEILPYFQ
jgi:uncharacterized protein